MNLYHSVQFSILNLALSFHLWLPESWSMLIYSDTVNTFLWWFTSTYQETLPLCIVHILVSFVALVYTNTQAHGICGSKVWFSIILVFSSLLPFYCERSNRIDASQTVYGNVKSVNFVLDSTIDDIKVALKYLFIFAWTHHSNKDIHRFGISMMHKFPEQIMQGLLQNCSLSCETATFLPIQAYQ